MNPNNRKKLCDILKVSALLGVVGLISVWSIIKFVAVAAMIVALFGCCSPSATQIGTSKTDTVWVKHTVHDTTNIETVLHSRITDTIKVLVYPRIDSIDTNIRIAGTDIKFKFRKKNTEQNAEISLQASRTDSSMVKTVTHNTATYEAYTRPWWEYLMIVGIFLVGVVFGIIFKVLLRV